jgi:S-adenosylmethionine synthetase
LCDQVADAVLDECLKLDPLAVAGLNAVTKDKIVKIITLNDAIDFNNG